MNDVVENGTHILFTPSIPKKVTKVWRVDNKYGDGLLGHVAWFGRWRKYAFYTVPERVFEEVCLREIAEFCERKTKEHKQKRE